MDSVGLLVAAGAGFGLWYYLKRQSATTGGTAAPPGSSGGGQPGNPAQPTAIPAELTAIAERWRGRIAGDVAQSYQVNLESIDRVEDAGQWVRVHFTAGGGKFIASIAKGADPDRLAEGTNIGNYAYRYYHGTGITRIG